MVGGIDEGFARRPQRPGVAGIAVAVYIDDLRGNRAAGIDLVDDHTLPGKLYVVAHPTPCLHGVEATGSAADGNLYHQSVARLWLRQLLQRKGDRGACGDHIAPGAYPTLQVLMVGVGVLAQASIDSVAQIGAIRPGIAHHVPAVVVRAPIHS